MFKFFNNKILNGQSRTITSAAIVLAGATLASRFLGLLRDRLLAGHFGAGDTLDIYYAAFRIPDLVYNLLILGALSAGFIPVFVSLLNKDGENDETAWHFVSSILNILAIGMIILGGVFFLAAPYIMKWITPGFSGEKMNLTVQMSRLMFLSPILLGISSVWGGVLQSLKRFLIFSLTPIFYNLGIILGILFLVPRFGIYGLAYGVVLGALMHMSVQLPTILSLGFRFRFVLDWKDAGVRRLSKVIVPRILDLAVSQLNFVAITVLASSLAAGSLAVFNLAYNIWGFPLGIFAAPLAIAAFPTLSQNAAQKNHFAFAQNFSSTFRQILFLIIPASALFLVLRAQIIRVILGTGRFDWTDTIWTINTLQFFVLALFAEALNLLLIRSFFAHEDTKTPLILGFLSSIFRIGGAWIFSRYLGVSGLALGYALGGILLFFLLWIFLRRKTGGLNEAEIIKSGGKIVIASTAAGGAAYMLLRLLAAFFDTHTVLGIFTQGFVAGVLGIIIYFLVGLLLRLPEMQVFWRSLKNRLPWRAVAPNKEMIQE